MGPGVYGAFLTVDNSAIIKQGGNNMGEYKIKTATACYTGGGIYIYYGQLASGLYFRTTDCWDHISICDSDTESEEADYVEFYEDHAVMALIEEDFKIFFNAMLSHILNGGDAHGVFSNYSADDLKKRIIK